MRPRWTERKKGQRARLKKPKHVKAEEATPICVVFTVCLLALHHYCLYACLLLPWEIIKTSACDTEVQGGRYITCLCTLRRMVSSLRIFFNRSEYKSQRRGKKKNTHTHNFIKRRTIVKRALKRHAVVDDISSVVFDQREKEKKKKKKKSRFQLKHNSRSCSTDRKKKKEDLFSFSRDARIGKYMVMPISYSPKLTGPT